MSRSKMDPSHIIQTVYDEQLEATRVHLMPTEMEFDVHTMSVHDLKAGDIVDTQNAVRINVIADAAVEVKMVVLTKEVSLGPVLGIKEVCSPAIKVEADCIVVVQG